MYYISWIIDDALRCVEVVGEKSESDQQTREKAMKEYDKWRTTPGVSELDIHIMTVDIKFEDRKDATVYTYLCDVDPKSFAKLCGYNHVKPKRMPIIHPKDWRGNYFIDEHGDPKDFFFVSAGYKSAKELKEKAIQICNNRHMKYTGNLLQVFKVFHKQ